MSLRIPGLALALVAGGALLAYPAIDRRQQPPASATVDTAWPDAQRAVLSGTLADGTTFHPEAFLDADTAIGTAPTPDGTAVRLLLLPAQPAPPVELRRLPAAGSPEFGTVTPAGERLLWTESVDGGKVMLWSATTAGTSVRRLVADMADTVFAESAYDLVVAAGRGWWVTASSASVTEVRSVPLAGGAVAVRRVPGTWSLSAWPWLTDGAGMLRSLETGATLGRPTTNTSQPVCGPAWCRDLLLTTDGIARIDAVRPDGSSRRRIAGAQARAAINDVAVLDRFELLSEPQENSDLTGTEGLTVYDLSANRAVPVSPAVRGVFSRHGLLWWATGDESALTWNVLDLRTV